MTEIHLARRLVDVLEQRSLLDQDVIDALRQQLEESRGRATPEGIAKLLVDNGHLTKFQASKLIGDLRNGQPPPPSPAGGSSGSQEVDALLPTETAYEEVEVEVEVEPSPGRSSSSEPIRAEIVEDADDQVAEPPVMVEAIEPRKKKKSKRTQGAVGADVMEAGIAPGPPPQPRKPLPQKNQWDSFRIYGVAGLIGVLLIVGFTVSYLLMRGNSQDAMAKADEAYKKSDYRQSSGLYETFLSNFGSEGEQGSKAKVRLALSTILQAKQGGAAPDRVLELIVQKLTPIKGEAALEQDRGDVGELLMGVSESLVLAADGAKTTDEKEKFVTMLGEATTQLENPEYIPNALRASMKTRLDQLGENRARVLRDINRQKRLTETLAAMKERNDGRDPLAAYALRRTLVREYPQLIDDPALRERIMESSLVQKELVETGGPSLKALDADPASGSVASLALVNQRGQSIDDLVGQSIYLRARGSLVSLDAGTGALRWRRYVGESRDETPIRLGEEASAGVLVGSTQQKRLLRLDGMTGEVVWQLDVGTPFALPQVSGGNVYLGCEDGRVASISAESGATQWSTKLPQSMQTSPGGAGRGAPVYAVAVNSNIYVLANNDGSCQQAYYLGHGEGSVRVAPVVLLGHVFVVENVAPDRAVIHALRVDPKTGLIAAAQTPIPISGNVVTSPQVVGRRLVVLSDRSEILVLDVEPTKETDQVSKLAMLGATSDPPVLCNIALAEGQAWVSGNRLAHYDLQFATGKIVRDWVDHEGDAFVGPPIRVGNAVIYARSLQGTDGVRVTATTTEAREPIWETDVGIPTTLLANDGGKGLVAINGQGILYKLALDQLSPGKSVPANPTEMPTDDPRGMRFGNPQALDGGVITLSNQKSTGQLLVYDEKRSRDKVRTVAMALGSGSISAPPVACPGGLLFPLDSGRLALVDPSVGRMKAQFMPATTPDQKLQWSQPVANREDPSLLIVADDQRRIFRIRVEDQLREVAKADLDRKPLGPLAMVGKTLVIAAAADSGDSVGFYDPNSLKLRNEDLLEGRIVFGPHATESFCVVFTDREGLVRYDEAGKRLWSASLPNFVPGFAPLAIDEQRWLLASRSGELIVIQPDTGEVVARQSLREPISAPPMSVGRGLLIGGEEGIVFAAQIPTEIAP
jgi:outer membrane protein assembly factor BamB